MRTLVIVKTGSSLPVLVARKGDFEHWILSGLATDPDRVTVVDAQNGHPLPDAAGIAGVVITGSHDMVTDRQPWSERAAAWLQGVVERGVPTLGICYGHQLLAHALGGQVADNPNGREYGTVPLHLAAEAARDPLFAGLSSPLEVQASHTQSVVRLPADTRRLAHTAREPNAAFAVGESAWGVQFHLEFDAEVVRTYIDHNAAILRAEGQDPSALSTGCHDTPVGSALLRRFGQIVSIKGG